MSKYLVDDLSAVSITSSLKAVLSSILQEPEFTWSGKQSTFARDETGQPDVKVAVGNCSLDFDLWEGLRNPAVVGLHPVGLDQLWDYYAGNTSTGTDELGRQTVFRIPEPYAKARERFGRAVIVSVMLPVAEERARGYAALMNSGIQAPPGDYRRAMNEISDLVNLSVTRLVHHLIREDRAVLAMNGRTVSDVTEQTVPMSQRGDAHGVCKPVNYPQKSIAVLTGLGQFGAHRLVMRDELISGQVRRFMGPLSSLIIFDQHEPSSGDGMHLIDAEWRERVFHLHSGHPQVADLRFCAHFAGTGCDSCLRVCPADALANSTPGSEGGWPEPIARQHHRFWDGQLQFDHRNCTQPRSQMAGLYGDWICGRCLAVCVAEGGRSTQAAREWA